MIEEIKEILDNQKLINVENDYEKIIFEYLANNCSEFDDEHIKQLVNLKVEQYKQSLEHITNLQQLYENALKVNQNENKYRTELEDKYVVLQQENEFLKLNNPEMNMEHFRIVKENKRKIDNLRKENKRLKEKINTLKSNFEVEIDDCENYKKWYRDYKSRCEKANDFIDNYDVFKEFSFPLMKRDIENQIK